MKLASYVSGSWVEGSDEGTALIDPVSGAELARASTTGVDIATALDHARQKGGASLRAMSFAERAGLIKGIADTLTANRDSYFETALANSGNTKVDAMIDIDGGIGTLKFFAHVGQSLGDAKTLKDGRFERLAKDEAFQAFHLSVPIQGVGLHINAFNFPSWGMWEKAAITLLAGVPVFAKPATATALLSYQMVKDVIDAGVLPEGALSLVCGSARELTDNLTAQDAVAFTGSADTAAILRNHPNVVGSSVRMNVEADSLNTAILGPDATAGSAEFALFIKEVSREMTTKAGQKCTAIRRAFVPKALMDDVAGALEARLAGTVVGDPRNETVRMGPVINKSQQKDVQDAINQLKTEATMILGGDPKLVDADTDKGCFIAPTLLRCDTPSEAKIVHEVEAFGPVSTLMPYDSPEQAFELSGRGGGSLVASVFSGDAAFNKDAVIGLGAWHGRVLAVDESIGASQTGHGIVMPMCVHGGPGRAGGGEELGGLRGLRFYSQRLAVQGNKDLLESLAEDAAELPC
ncbi:MAG: 3,4-dehydroadipyl-CoA semialdehyde dehydrogenase [Rhodospirillales bacterium]|jgi:3,4-dehydroadipyl-CoA semialdehyde dehydrogenase|nr:3,4-dehydroadipyl-CoA semialdehyde dehydrogenase [Rhodospirillales bacterium]MBT5075970.1 3,4-dehydroadipyl-CoA semialdehyde dehydrogenase [Rhodospirillales bacterium]MBT5113536.1 3,4-dehydroadipyl-CoA semialdehyde dehydrogenase [Rhodospirillales bacterium]MBT5673834.1 3,4-dehydroadipyl-CoA semialdehyde dehydrogenase [Rhodospirillales bacterium]MBT6186492.1 3,4-dehydroadipyl-CoA semialdehyde dehydrogenase [Rhodospirillales bacterium]